MKKVLNIISYTLNVVFIIIILLAVFGRKTEGSQVDIIQDMKTSIIDQERANLPLLVQKFEHVHAITIDSMVVTNNVEPYSGYLVTTWDMDEKQNLTTHQWAANGYEDKYVRKNKTVFVEVRNITTNKGTVSWSTNWIGAQFSVMEGD